MRRLGLIAAAVAAVLAAGYTVFWFRAADALQAGVAGWQQARRAEGWDLALGAVETTGFPFRLAAVADGFTIGRGGPVPWRWSGPRLVVSAPPWGGDDVSLDAPGAHRARADLPAGPVALALDAATAHGTARLGPDGRVAALHVVLAGVTGHSADGAPFHVDTVVLSLSGAPGPAASPAAGAAAGGLRAPEAGRLHLTADGLDLPDGAAGPLGRRIDHGEADVTLDGALPAGPSRAALAAWRDAGGTVELHRIKLDWGTFRAEANGTLALDAELQPIGAFTTRMWGVETALDALVVAGTIDARAGAMAKIVLRMMAKPAAAPGQPSEIEVPLALQDRKLYLGPAAVARLPRIDWPDGGDER